MRSDPIISPHKPQKLPQQNPMQQFVLRKQQKLLQEDSIQSEKPCTKSPGKLHTILNSQKGSTSPPPTPTPPPPPAHSLFNVPFDTTWKAYCCARAVQCQNIKKNTLKMDHHLNLKSSEKWGCPRGQRICNFFGID